MLIDRKMMRFAAIMSNAVLTKGFLLFAGYYGGSKLDERWGTYPVFLMIGLCLGLGLGLWYVLFMFNRTKPK